jgi:HSP20 family protein
VDISSQVFNPIIKSEMLPRLRNTAFFPGWVDDFFAGATWPDLETRTGATMPAVNVREDENQFNIDVAAPGMDKKDFKLELDHNVLTILAEKEGEKVEKKQKFSRREFNYASFRRSFTMPNSAKEEGIEASYKDGILSIIIPKREEAKAKPIRNIDIK